MVSCPLRTWLGVHSPCMLDYSSTCFSDNTFLQPVQTEAYLVHYMERLSLTSHKLPFSVSFFLLIILAFWLRSTFTKGMHTIKDRPVVVDGQIVIRPIMVVALTYDHRLLDGREAVTFLGENTTFCIMTLKLNMDLVQWKSRSTLKTQRKCFSLFESSSNGSADCGTGTFMYINPIIIYQFSANRLVCSSIFFYIPHYRLVIIYFFLK